jgi:hypothetical protein
MPDEVGLNVLSFIFHQHSLLDPASGLPAFEFESDLVGINGLDEVEVNMALYCVACEIEGFINLDEST